MNIPLSRSLAIFSVSLLAASLSSPAAQVAWDGDVSQNWDNGANWSGNTVPNNDQVTINNPTNTPVIMNSPVSSIRSLNIATTNTASLNLDTVGSLSVTNSGSSVTVGVGAGSNGTLSLQSAGTSLTINNGGGVLVLAQDAGSTGTLNLGSGGSAGVINAARIRGGDGTAVINLNNGFDQTVAARITGSASVNQIGTAVTTLTNGNNNYTGDTTINNGTLRGGAENSFSSQSDHIVNATLDLGGFHQDIRSLTGNVNGLVTNNGSDNAILTTGDGGVNLYEGTLRDGTSRLALRIINNTTQILNAGGVNDYSGRTQINTGSTLVAGADEVFSDQSNHNVDGTLDLNGFDNQIGGLSGDANGVVTNTGTSDAILRSGKGQTRDFEGAIIDGPTNSLGLWVINDSIQILSGSGLNTYSGNTRVAAKSVLLGNATNAFSAFSAHRLSGQGRLDLGGFDQEIGSLRGGPRTVVTNNGSADATLLTGGLNTDTDFQGVIRDGTAAIGFSKIGTGTQTLSGVNTYSGQTTIGQGTLVFANDTSYLGGNIGNSAALVFNQDEDSNYYGSIQGPGTVTKEGLGYLNLTGNSSVGATNVNNGGLFINGIFEATQLNVAMGAVLGGSGTIVSNVTNNGTLAPGNSPGTLTINGNYTQTGSGVFELEIASQSVFDRLIVSGNAALAGELQVYGFGGYKPEYGQRYTFLQAGSITGNFDSIYLDDMENFRARFLISNGFGTLVLAPSSYTLMAQNQNQYNVAKALDSFIFATSGDRQVVATALDSLSAAEYPAAFDAISPTFYETLTNITFEQTTAQNQMLAQRMSAVRLGARGFNVIGLDRAALRYDKDGKSTVDAKGSKDIVAPSVDTKWSVWVQGNGIFARTMSVSQVPTYHYEGGGVFVGADYKWNENFTTGIYGGYQGVYSRYNNGGLTTINSALFGGYATYSQGGFYSDAIVGGGYNGYNVRRPINFGSIDRTAASEPNGGQFNAYLDLGYDWKIGNFTLGPVVSGQYIYSGIAPFTEDNADSLDLRVGQQNANSIRTNIGGRIAYTWNVTDTISIIPEGRMFWQHEYLNGPRNIASSLDGGAGPAFGYTTTTPGRDSVFAGAGVSANFGDRWTTSFYYNADFGRQDFVSHMISGGVTWKF